MKRKKFFIIPISVIFLFVIYKACLILYYKDLNNYAVDYSIFSINSKKVITDKNLSNTKIGYLNMYIPNNLKRVISEYSPDTTYYIPNDEELDDYSNMISIHKANICFDILYNEDKRLQTIGISKLLENNGIYTESDLIKYNYENRKDNSLFTSKNEIKMRYLADICVKNSILTDARDYNYYLDGDLEGMLVVSEDNYRLKLFDKKHNDYHYISINKYKKNDNYKEILTEDEIWNIINSIYFD